MRTWNVGIRMVLALLAVPARAVLAQRTSADDLAQVRMAIDAQNRVWAEAVQRGDAATIARLFADSGVEVSVGGGRLWKGREAIQELFAGVFRNPRATAAIVETEQMLVDGPTAVEYGHYRFTYPPKDGTPQVERGKYVVVWRRGEDGAWRILMDMGVPAPPAP